MHAQAGQFGHLGGMGGDHRGGAAPDGGLEPDPRRGRAVGPHPVAPFGDAERAEFLHDRYALVASGGQRRQAAGPAQCVHDVGAVLLPAAAQRAAERRDPLEQASVAAVGGDRAGVDVLDPDAVVQFGPVGQVRLVLLGVDGDLVTLAGQAPGELGKSDVVTVRAGADPRVQGSRVLGDKSDLHEGGLLADETLSRCRQREMKKWCLIQALRENTVSR